MMTTMTLANGETVTIVKQTGRTRLQFDSLFKVGVSVIDDLQADLQVDETRLLTLVYHFCLASVRCDSTGEFNDILAPLSATPEQFKTAFLRMVDSTTANGLDYVGLIREVNVKIEEMDRPTSEPHMQPSAQLDPN
jgi:hypothetical protein